VTDGPSYPPSALEQLVRFRNGKSIKPGGKGAHPVYGSNGIIGASDSHMYEDAIIIGRVGAYCGSVKYCPSRFWASDNTIIVEPISDRVDTLFIYYLLHNANLNRHAGGAAQPLLTQSSLKQLEFSIPPLPTQRRIASILSAYDDLIENNTRRIAILEEMARRLYDEWFVQFRFPGHEGVPMVDSEIGKVPEGWELTTVASAVKRFTTGKKYNQKTVEPDGNVPVLDQGQSGVIGFHNGEPGFAASTDDPVIVFANHTCYQRLVFFPFSTIQNVIPYKSNEAFERDIFWLHHTTYGLVELNDYKGHWPQFAARPVLVPTLTLAASFGLLVRPFHILTYNLSRKNSNLRTQRDLLLPKLISGEIDVSEVGESAEEVAA
jgi:type I restriction enzyme S subunit